MGNDVSSQVSGDSHQKKSSGYTEFFSSAGKTIGEASGIVCGSLNDTYDERNGKENMRKRTNRNGGLAGIGIGGDGDDLLCGDGQFSPDSRGEKSLNTFANPDDDSSLQTNPMSALFARALLNEVTDNPATMRPTDMAAREKKLLKAQERAKTASKSNLRAVGGQGTMKSQLNTLGQNATSRMMPSSMLSDNRAQMRSEDESPGGKYRVSIGLMLSRRDVNLGHTDTITRQTAFDFNELQDRQYKFVSSTDSSGWRAGGGESGQPITSNQGNMGISNSDDDDDLNAGVKQQSQQQSPKVAAQDTVHIPIIHIDCDSSVAIDSVIAALARGEVFIPHMSILPEALGVNGISPPDLVVRFGCERNEDMPPEDWPNWCLEFMHNQLYDYFSDMGAKWMKRPFQITLAKKVRWKTVKHMNKFFTNSENVINRWREKGPQFLDPQQSYIEGGASPEEVARPHGIYLLRNGKPTNYFAPNFEPPYTTKMTRSLLLNVMGKSWDRKRRDWSSEPLARVTTSLLLSTMCGCAEPNDGGFIAREVTTAISPYSVKSRTPSYFGDKTNVSPSRTGEYSPFKSKSRQPIQPQLTQKAHQQHQKLYEGLKVTRDDSGIRRSRLNPTNNLSNRDESITRSERSDSTSSRRSKSSMMSNSREKKQVQKVPQTQPQPQPQDKESMSLSDEQLHEESLPLHQNDKHTSDLDWSTPDKNYDITANDLDSERFDIDMQSPKNYFSPSKKETPVINNQFNQKSKSKYNNDLALEQSIPENSGAHYDSKSSFDREEDMAVGRPQSQNSGNQDAGISVGESQTTVPTMNGSSAKFIEQERERRKERELQREKEREKMDKLERAIEEKKKMNQEKLLSTPKRDTEKKDKESTERKASKKEKRAKKEKKKREKKERRERSGSSRSSKKVDNSDGKDIDWSMESLSQQAIKENFPMKNDPQPLRDNSNETNPQKDVDWTNDSSYLPINLNGDKLNDSPSGSRHSAADLNSQISLDYSADTASMLGGDGSLLGGQFAGDGSVFTQGTAASDNKSLLSCVTRSTVHDMTGKLRPALNTKQEDDDISLTLMASTSSGMELIPTDEELFAIGWAKAMDPNSGSYYYFTLDRSKTVWDNPLKSKPDP